MNHIRLSHRLCRRGNVFWTSDFVSKSCRTSSTSTTRSRFVSTQPEKPYYITTPIFYVNAAPHIGHLYTMVLTDILKRWQVLRGKPAILCTGTDEHGMKIQRAAEKAQTPTKEFCDRGAEIFKKLAARAELSNDHFVRTTDQDHKDAAQHFWRMLNERGYIYESKHEGYYCVSDETFYPFTALEKRLNPFNGRTFLASKETGKEVEWTSEINYHFRLSAFKDRLLEFYRENPQFVVPAGRMNDVVKQVEEGLEDLSISRPSSRLKWGIAVPNDDSQTMYVWLDALINYITKAGYPWAPGEENAGGWPADVQVMGKDIVRFHCIYWPAFLLALDIPLPKQVLTHAHWTMNRQKMSKSDGSGVDPDFALDRFGVDAMRYYLALDGGIVDDADYGNHRIVEKYKKGLQGGLGNLVNRITKTFDLREAVVLADKGELPQPLERSVELQQLAGSVRDEATRSFEQLNPGEALYSIMHVVYECNKYISTMEPWMLAKSKNPNHRARLPEVIYTSGEVLRIVGILLQPFMPAKSSTLLDMVGVEEGRRGFDDAKVGVDGEYGKPLEGKEVGEQLFPRLSVED